MKKAICVSLILLFSVLLFCGCNDESNNRNFVIGYDDIGVFGCLETDDGTTYGTLEAVNSLQELKDLCEERNSPAFQEDSEQYSSQLSQKIRNYDDDYFVGKSLVIYSFFRGHQKETIIESVEKDGEKLIVNVSYKLKKGTFTEEAFSWVILIEIDKNIAAGTTSVEIIQK